MLKYGGRVGALIACAGAVTLAWGQEWALEELRERSLSDAERLRQMQEKVFHRYGAELGYKSADEIPIMDKRYEALDREVKRLEALLKQDQAADLRAQREAELRAAEAAREARARELARQKAEAEARRLAEVEAPFREALALYRQKQYPSAYDRFMKLYFERKESVPVAFYTGRSAFETQRYEIAAGAYQQVLALDPDHQRAKLELARTYYIMGMLRESKALFEEVGQNPELPPEVSRNIQAYLDSIEEMQKRHRLSGQLIAGLGFDSNVNQGNDYVIRGLESMGVGNPAKSDSLLTLASFSTHHYDMGEPAGWLWQSDLLLFTNKYSELSQNDLLLIGLQTGPVSDLGAGRIRFPVGYDKVWVENEAFMSILSVGVGYERPFGRLHAGKANLKWLDRVNSDSANSDRDATGYELGIEWQGMNADQNRILNAGFGFVSEAPKTGERPDSEFTSMGLRAGATWLQKPWAYGGSVQLKRVDYANEFVKLAADGGGAVAPDGTVKREDTLIALGLFATRTLQENLTLGGQLGWQQNDSTHEPYSYNKTTLQINLSWGWSL